MDHFESIIRTLLEADHFWVQSSFKVELTPEEKREIGKHSIPRPEIDLLAMNFAANEVRVVEAKSYLDSPGVKLKDLEIEHDIPDGRYKLFTSTRYRTIVLKKLHSQLCSSGMANSETKLTLALAAGKVYQKQTAAIQELFNRKGFIFISPELIREKVTALARRDYENDPAIITAKILLRQ